MNSYITSGLFSLWIFLSTCSEVIFCNESQSVQEQIAIEGSSYKMKCTDAVGPKIPEFSLNFIVIWSVNGRLPKGPKFKLLTDGLVVRNISKEDTFSNYTCTVLDRSTLKPISSANIKLRLRQRAGKILDSKEDINTGSTWNERKVRVWGIVNQWVKLQCNVFSRPSPTFMWSNVDSGEKITNSSNIYEIVENDNRSNLTILLHNKTFFGEYVCTASNVHGQTSQHFVVTEGYKPKPPFFYPTYIGKNSITLKLELQEGLQSDLSSNDSLPITKYYIQYIEEADIASSSLVPGQLRKNWTTVINTTPASSIGTYSYIGNHFNELFELKNLKINTTYVVRCAVANVAAVSDFSNTIRITTDGYEPGNLTTSEYKEMASRKDYARSSNYESGNPTANATASSAAVPEQLKCGIPRFKKTVVRTVTSTTLIENLLESNAALGNETAPFVNKHVEEDTFVERVLLCDI